jgi:hypothetical protein
MAMHHSNQFVPTTQTARVSKGLILLSALALQSACAGTGDAQGDPSGFEATEAAVDPVTPHEDDLESGEGDAVASEPGGASGSDEDALPSEDALEREDALHEDQMAQLPEDFPEATPVDEQSMTWEGGEVALTDPEANLQDSDAVELKAASAVAVARNGSCGHGETCLFEDDDYKGGIFEVWTRDNALGNNHWYNRDSWVGNEASSVWNRRNCTVVFYKNNNLSGAAYQVLAQAKHNINRDFEDQISSYKGCL